MKMTELLSHMVVRPNADTDIQLCSQIDDLQFYVLLNSISVISGGWLGDNERICVLEPRLRLKRSPLAGLEPGTAR